MERMDSQHEGLPDGTQVLKEINSTDELERAKTYFNASNGKLLLFLGRVISLDGGQLVFVWKQINPVTGKPMESDESGDEVLPLLRVDLPDGFLKIA